ncbi:MAG: hypothetical protein H6985_13765 [Pseudomonadales bacterium]|nr:hypothetical protein [Pseudomonadales bacterium]
MFKTTFAIAFALVATLSFSQSVAAEQESAATATVVIYRADESAKTRRLGLDVHVNDSSLGRLTPDAVVVAAGPLGQYTLSTSMPGTEPLTLELKAGTTYYVHTKVKMRGTRVYVTLEPVEEQVAKLQQPALVAAI